MNKHEILRTPRLILREMTREDFGDLAEMLQDADVMYAYEHTFTEQDVWEWLRRQQTRYRRDGFGLWAMELRQTGEMVGQAGLTWQTCEGETVLEIGYLLKRRHWHNGFAREAAGACKEYAFDVLGAERVCSIIKTDNSASARVAEAIGMRPEKTFLAQFYAGPRPHVLYACRREEAPEK